MQIKRSVGLWVMSIFGLIAVWIGFQMKAMADAQVLWNYEALFLFACAWLAVNGFLFSRSKTPQSTLKAIGLSSVAGAFLALGFSPFTIPITIFIGLVPILYLLEDRNVPNKLLHVFLALWLWNILSTFWVANTSFGSGLFANVANALLTMIPIAAFQASKKLFAPKFKWYIFVSFWISWEFIHMQWDLSWPWLNLGNAFGMAPNWVQWYELTGMFGGTLWILLVNILAFICYQKVGVLIHKAWLKPVGAFVLPLLVSLAFFSFRNLEVQGSLNTLVVQPNYEPHYQKFSVPPALQNNQIQSLIEPQLDNTIDYLVLPESVFNRFEINDPSARSPGMASLEKLVQQYPNLNIVGGAATYKILDEEDPSETALRESERNGIKTYYVVYNAAFSLNQINGYEWYFKSKLVPGAEIFPFRNLFFFMKPLVKSVGGSFEGHGTQKERTVFESTTEVAPAICYESVYGDYTGGFIRNGAKIIFVVTNDGWWGDTPGHIQHLGFSRLRAIEHRRPVVRSANTGISCWIDPFGVVNQPTNYEEATAFTSTILTYETLTIYTRYGDIIAKIALLMSFLFGLNALSKRLLPRKTA